MDACVRIVYQFVIKYKTTCESCDTCHVYCRRVSVYNVYYTPYNNIYNNDLRIFGVCRRRIVARHISYMCILSMNIEQIIICINVSKICPLITQMPLYVSAIN